MAHCLKSERTNFEKRFEKRIGNFLTIRTMQWPARLMYKELTVENDDIEEDAKGCLDLKFVVSVPEKHVFDLKYADDFQPIISIYVGADFCAQVEVVNNRLVFDGMYTASEKCVTQQFTAVQPLHKKFNMRLMITCCEDVHRVDWRLSANCWVSSFLFNKRLLTARPNGDWFAKQLSQIGQLQRGETSGENESVTSERPESVASNAASAVNKGSQPAGGQGMSQLVESAQYVSPPSWQVPKSCQLLENLTQQNVFRLQQTQSGGAFEASQSQQQNAPENDNAKQARVNELLNIAKELTKSFNSFQISMNEICKNLNKDDENNN